MHSGQGLADAIEGWSPPTETSATVLDVSTAAVVADVLDSNVGAFRDGDVLPVLWHWPYFAKRSGLLGLGADGHPEAGPLYPPIPDRRRMFVGGRVTVHRELRLGWAASVEDEIIGREVKRGRTGEMLFVTVRRTLTQAGEVCVVEEQDIMYRSGEAAKAARAAGSEQRGFADGPAAALAVPTFTTTKLFAFSAITSNAHRIHYDLDYARDVEGYRGLVVHGPLLILSMLELARAVSDGRQVASLSYRLQSPVICGDDVRIEARDVDGQVQLVMSSSQNDVVASARVTLR